MQRNADHLFLLTGSVGQRNCVLLMNDAPLEIVVDQDKKSDSHSPVAVSIQDGV